MEVQQRMTRGPQVEAGLLLLAFGDEWRGNEAGGRTRCSSERRRGTWRRGRPEVAAGGARGGRRRVASDGVARARAMQGGSWATGTTCGGFDEWRGGGGAGRRGHGRSKPGMATRLDGGVGRGREVEQRETEHCGARARRSKGRGSSEGDGGAREETRGRWGSAMGVWRRRKRTKGEMGIERWSG